MLISDFYFSDFGPESENKKSPKISVFTVYYIKLSDKQRDASTIPAHMRYDMYTHFFYKDHDPYRLRVIWPLFYKDHFTV